MVEWTYKAAHQVRVEEQLPAIEHPGGLRGPIDRLKPIKLHEVRRLRDPTKRAAVEFVRSGRGSSALAAYQERGHLTIAETIPVMAGETRQKYARSDPRRSPPS